jgi:hypothetical protein
LINANNALIEDGFDNTLSLDGTEPNSMLADLDMNSNRILNLPRPLEDTEPVRLEDLTTLLGDQSTLELDDLTDVVITSPTSGQLLQYDGAEWVNSTITSGNAPSTADYLVKTADAGLSAERVVTDTTSITWGLGDIWPSSG